MSNTRVLSSIISHWNQTTTISFPIYLSSPFYTYLLMKSSTLQRQPVIKCKCLSCVVLNPLCLQESRYMQRHTNTVRFPWQHKQQQTNLPHWDFHYRERSCHRRIDEERYTAHLGRYRRPPECRCHGECPGQRLDENFGIATCGQIYQPINQLQTNKCYKN